MPQNRPWNTVFFMLQPMVAQKVKQQKTIKKIVGRPLDRPLPFASLPKKNL